MTVLSATDIEKSRKIFTTFDKDESGTIDVQELRAALRLLGQQPTIEELYIIISQVDEDRSGTIDFKEFLSVIEKQKLEEATQNDETSTVEAFVALGGRADKTGTISIERLMNTIKDFELAVDMDSLLAEADRDTSGGIDFNEFKQLLGE